ncbi:WXG100 family type VII secretion target [Amycolatopsis sp. GA6-003]|uniref:WXG100 family type VII secretion target n=1 Tax=Amycolatopsis sp. GA6-003 TaxID=2652444 RepID=UPI00391706B8
MAEKKPPTAESVSDPSSTDYDPRNKDLYNPTLDPSSKYYIGPVRPDDVASGDQLREDATAKIDAMFNGWLFPNVQGKLRDQLIQKMYERNLDESRKQLGKDLEMRDPGAAPHTDWKNATHPQMVEAITSEADPAAVAESSEEWVRIGNELATHQKNLGDAINASTSDWKGAGGDAARVHLANVGKWLGATAQGATLTGRQQEIHSQALNETQKAMQANPPVEFSAQDANRVLMTIKDPAAYVVAYSSAMKTYNDQQAAREQAAQIMTRYDQTIGGAVATPRFAEPPKLPTAQYEAAVKGTPLGGGGAGAPGGLRVGPDGRPIGPDGQPIGPPGTTVGPNGQLIGPDGRPLGPDGRPVGPPGTTVGPDGQLIGPDGKPLGGSGGSGGGPGGGTGGPGGQHPDRKFDPASLKIPEGGPGGGPGGGGPGGGPGGSFPSIPGSNDPGSTKAQGFAPPNLPPIPGGGNPGGTNFTPPNLPPIPGGGNPGGGGPNFTPPSIPPIPTGKDGDPYKPTPYKPQPFKPSIPEGPGGLKPFEPKPFAPGKIGPDGKPLFPGGGTGPSGEKLGGIGKLGGVNGESISSRLGGGGAGGLGGGKGGPGSGGGGAFSGAGGSGPAEEGVAGRGSGAGGAGAKGAAGAPGMGAMGGGKGGKGPEDKEHKVASFVEADDPSFFAPDEVVAPPVIGDWKNKDWK